ncbi:MAG: hypothetical protein KBT00_07455 [Bacteroidales bacterium]|nr:hypothetical protein [Candidatus Cacconaster merdequi]
MSTLENEKNLDRHCSGLMEQYRNLLPVLKKMDSFISKSIDENIRGNGIYVTAIETRIKAENSLAGKLASKGYKYDTIFDLTDLVGARIITFYTDEVDKIAAMVDRIFDVDWQNSIDKRKNHQLDSFGYNSLHYICRIPKEMYSDPEFPEINEIRFEVQMRTALQHVWATINHDIGYKSGVEIPAEYLRNINRLAGMLELADEQFSVIRTEISDYRRKVQELVESGNLDEVPLNGDTFKSYLNLRPFDKLTKKIAAINQAEIHESSAIPYFNVLSRFGFSTLGDLDRFIKENSDDAYNLATYQLAATDIDILSSVVSVQDLCEVFILKNGGGIKGLTEMFDCINGKSESNAARALRVYETAKSLSFMCKNKQQIHNG